MRDEWVLGSAQEYQSRRTARRPTSRSEKRTASDLLSSLVAFLLILALLPLLATIALAIVVQDGGPVFFAHMRVGRDGRLFPCLKFRSMAVDADRRLADYLASDPYARVEWIEHQKLRSDPRITPLGAFLRKSSLDELPQIFNVLRGEMSLVGPRPIVPEEIQRYGSRFKYYRQVKPGITGFWQVNGRNDVSYRRRVAMDTVYARSKSVMLDLRILAMTIPAVLFRRGSY